MPPDTQTDVRGPASRPVRARTSAARRGRFARSAPGFEVRQSKLRPEMSHRGTVPRVGVIKQLEEEAGAARVVLLSAGAGWGKTTVLAQWAAQSSRPFAWVSADTSDN